MATGSAEAPRADLPRLHIITDRGVLEDPAFVSTAASLMEAGGPAVALHLRGHGLGGSRLWTLGKACVTAARSAGAALIVNDRLDVALALASWGLQLGTRSFTVEEARSVGYRGRVGVSVHSAGEAVDALHAGADFVLAGTVFDSRSHPHGSTLGMAGLVDFVTAGLPVIAIGGIEPRHLAGIRRTGAHGVAVLGGIWRAHRPVDALRQYLEETE